MGRFHSLNEYFKNKFGEKIYKVSLDGGFSCPNRDGVISTGGCIFCSDRGSGEFTGERGNSITEQINSQLKKLENKFPNGRVVAYFQNFTNTYGEIEYLKNIYYEALNHPRVIGIAIATRPDCINEGVLELLNEINKKYLLWVEFGLQTSDNEIAKFINRGYETKVYEDAMERLSNFNIKVVTHIILGLPNSTLEKELLTAATAVRSKTWGVKIHLLYIVKGTKLEEIYKKHEIKLLELEEYVHRVVKILEALPKDIIIHRVTGDGDKASLVGPLWSLNKKNVLNSIEKEMKKNESFQGKSYSN